ncbi:hypothetical protein OIDMADRAFT_35187 [Oidiodendron maius Zn]|uniref:ABM domain-containing protein n=1 Tax=Oidiodendron maius (strain Zn) TaxID=913774 RepID=A0A0C3GDA6_OIDMZ|nr:hypothetical protein OIDMADRAFT_35187 [Oidiodendron maius Zn]
MSFTEVIIPSFKQDSNTRGLMQKVWPTASSVFHRTPAIQSGLAGQVLLDNGSSVGDGVKLMCLFEWESHEGFKSFLSSQEFETFIGQIGSLLLKPATPQLFKTNRAVRYLQPSPVTEILRLQADPHYPRDNAWEQLIATIEAHSGHTHQSLCGHSVNLEEELWLGIVTWDSLESRDAIRRRPEVTASIRNLMRGQEPDIVIVEVESFIAPLIWIFGT